MAKAETANKPRASGPEDAVLGKKIRARRIAAEMSQERLASFLGVSFQQVQKYEKGVNRVTLARIEQIAGALGESPSYFLSGKECGVSKTGQEMQALMAEPINQRILKALGSLDSSTKYKIAQLVEHIAALVAE